MKLSAFLPRSLPLGALLAGVAWLTMGGSLARAQAVFTSAQVGVPYSFQVVTNPASPGGRVYGPTILPTGLSINPPPGRIAGTPTPGGTYTGVISRAFKGVPNTPAYPITVAAALGTP